jgi:hypothetical protein
MFYTVNGYLKLTKTMNQIINNKIMKEKHQLTLAGKLVATGLIVAIAGVLIQIVSGVHYPKVPPVFFILLVPVVLITVTRLRWTPIAAIIAGLFLILGLFSSGASVRLFNTDQPGGFGGSAGLWIQMLGVVIATVAAIVSTIENYKVRTT